MSYFAPQYKLEAFHCPNCGVYAKQHWGPLRYFRYNSYAETTMDGAQCTHCSEYSYWHNHKLTVPSTSTVEMPSMDLPESCRGEYLEARDIIDISPRGSAALLRLCIQKLLKELGKSGKNINEDIADLVRDGLPLLVQQSLDICRVVGNNAVHPGEIDLQDTPEIARSIFRLINLIVHDRISRPKEVQALYDALPTGARDAIDRRDGA